MALEDLTPVTRTEAILDGDDISPVTRLEYFLGKAANEVPKPAGVSDAGKVPTVNAAGDGFELDTPASGGGYIVHITGTPPNLSTVESYADIVNALQTGPAFLLIPDEIFYYLPLLYINEALLATMVTYEVGSTAITVGITKYTINSDGSLDVDSYQGAMAIVT